MKRIQVNEYGFVVLMFEEILDFFENACDCLHFGEGKEDWYKATLPYVTEESANKIWDAAFTLMVAETQPDLKILEDIEWRPLEIICVADKDYEQVVKEHNVSLDSMRNNWWYLHGSLEAKFLYDKATILNFKDWAGPRTVKTLAYTGSINGISYEQNPRMIQQMCFTGIVPVKVHGVDEECVGYFWTEGHSYCTNIDKDGNEMNYPIWRQRGLVVLKSDKDDVAFAEEAYRKRQTIL